MSDRVYHCSGFTRSPDKPYCMKGEFKEKVYEYVVTNHMKYGVRTPQAEVFKHFVYNNYKSILKAINDLEEEGVIKKYKDDMTGKEVVTFRKSKMCRNIIVLEVV